MTPATPPERGLAAYAAAVNPARLRSLEAGGGPVAFTRAEGAWLEDVSGRRYLDMVGGYGTATLGHHPPRVMAALADALSSSQPFTHPASVSLTAGELARELCVRAGGGLRKVYFGNSGAEGVEAALKLAMAATGRRHFVAFSEAFHGLTLGALQLCGAEAWRAPFAAPAVAVDRVPFGDVGAVERCFGKHPVAGVVVEVVQGMAGARPWPPAELRRLAALCRAHGALLVVDEVLTGVGRTGRWFASQGLGQVPGDSADPSTKMSGDWTLKDDSAQPPSDPSKVPRDSSKVPRDSSKVAQPPSDPSKVPRDPSKVPRDSSKVPRDSVDGPLSVDLLVTAKGLTGGAVPLCAVLMTDAVYEAVYAGAGRANLHTSTFEANLLAVTAGLAVLRELDAGELLARVRHTGAELARRLGELAASGVSDVRGAGLLLACRVDERVRCGELWGAPACRRLLLDRGVFTQVAAQAPDYLLLTPPFTLTDDEVDLFCDRLRAALTAGS